jgi:hypothetical protein
MARILLRRGSPAAVLITTRQYSSTTSGHLLQVRRAVQHLPVFNVHDVFCRRRSQLIEYRNRIEREAESAASSRLAETMQHRLAVLDSTVSEANAYCEFFGLKTRFGYPEGFSLETAKEWLADAKSRETAREKERAANRLRIARKHFSEETVKYANRLEAWLNGAPLVVALVPPSDPDDPTEERRRVFARLRVLGDEIETSYGASVPIADAKKFLRIVRVRAIGRKVFRNLKLGRYAGAGVAVNFTERALTVGCHTVEFDEIERIAGLLGL